MSESTEKQMQPASVFNTPDYRRSRVSYLIECAFEYFVSLLLTDAFLTKLLHSIGFDDAACGLIASVISLAFLFQLAAVFLVRHITNTKRTAVIIHTAAQLLFGVLYLIPFLPAAAGVKRGLTILYLLAAYFGNYLVTVVIYRWANGFVNPDHRARYSAVKEMCSLLSGIAVTLLLGTAIDRYEAAGEIEKGFLFAAAAVLVFVIGDFICLLGIRNEVKDSTQTDTRPAMREVLSATLGNPRFRRVIVLFTLFEMSRYALIGFLGTFKWQDLMYDVGMIQIINMAGSLLRAAISPAYGRFSDKHSYIKGIELACVLLIAADVCIMFTTRETRWLIWGYTVLSCFASAGHGQNFLNITYSYVDKRYFAEATAIKNSIGGLCGFLCAIASGRLLAFIQANGNTLFGFHVLGQQVQAAISLLLMAAALLYARLVVGKQAITGK